METKDKLESWRLVVFAPLVCNITAGAFSLILLDEPEGALSQIEILDKAKECSIL